MRRAVSRAEGTDLLASWIDGSRRRGELRARLTGAAAAAAGGGLRFAFYGRISTEDYQDRLSSARWQRDFAEDLVGGHGRIVAEFFDVGVSRRLAWSRRPQAARLLAAVAHAEREFDAIVVGEYERAFCGDQLEALVPVLRRHRVAVWLPELDGPVDLADPTHRALLALLGVHSKREVLRVRYRVIAAMRAQVQHQGRTMGGRPPYGYRLVDAGPHRNQAYARWGRRAQRLEPDPATAPTVRRMFALRLAGHSVASIARALNEQQVPCPSRVDPGRNRHPTGKEWTLRTVATILRNPRYTGRQVWNRQSTDYDVTGQPDDVLGRTDARRWNPPQGWVVSDRVVHSPLVSEEEFVAVQAVRSGRLPVCAAPRVFRLAGLLVCRLCGRHLDAHWVHGRAAYRCRHGHRSSASPQRDRPGIVYVREDQVLIFLASHVPALRHLDPAAADGAELLAGYLAGYERPGRDLRSRPVDSRDQLAAGCAGAAAPHASILSHPRRSRNRRVIMTVR
jgi:site-specific DNA recombinase